MELYSISSGSSGNCIMIGTDNHRVLIDTGLSKKKIVTGLNEVGLKGEDVDAIFVTHEHWDHVSGLGVMARGFGKPIYGSKGTLKSVKRMKSLGAIDDSLFNVVDAGEWMTFGDLSITSIRVSHDAAEPLMYIAKAGDKSAAVVTDLGKYDESIIASLKGLDAILIESNYDERMLMTGSYPYELKQRILGDRGHLSNEMSGQLLCSLLHDDMKHIFLGHLSQENNYPDLAYEAVRMEITMGDNPYKASDFPIRVAKRDVPTEMVRF